MKKRIITFILAVLMLTATLALTVHAEGNYTNWEWSDSGSLIRTDPDGAVTEYKTVNAPAGYISAWESNAMLPRSFYYFVNSPDGDLYRIFAYTEDTECVFYLDEYGNIQLLATDEGKNHLNDYFTGNVHTAGSIYLSDNASSSYVEINAELVDKLDALTGNEITLEVSSLGEYEMARVITRDEYSMLDHEHGIIYQYGGELYYLNLEELPNNYFDSEGIFSERSGSVELTPVGGTLSSTVHYKLGAAELASTYYYYEDDGEGTIIPSLTLTEGQALAITLAAVLLLGVALPVLPIVFSARRLRGSDEDVKAPYAVMLGAASLWAAAGITLALLILI